jgi:hypothetical protein
VYFLCFLFIVCFFVQEIFVAVIIDNFKRLKSISNGSAFMTAQQREWVRLQRTLKSRQPRIQAAPTRDQCLRHHAYRLVMHRYFEPCVVLVVGFNVVGMLTYHYPQSQAWVRAQWTVDSVFTFVYLLEAALQLVAHGLHGYLTGSVTLWHPYDALLATWGLFVFCLGPIAQGSVFCLVTLRLGRTLRLFRVIRQSSHLKRLCRTFYFSLPSLKNIGMFLLLIYYIYAVGGMHLFSALPMGTYINEDANFSSFGLALLTLVRCTTGEEWNGLMHEADQATAHTRGKMAVLYFCSFMILISYVVLNLFIATMLENFQEDMANVGGVITTKHIRRFSQLWTELKTKSLRGDLTKINNRAARVATPVVRKPGAATSAVRFLPIFPLPDRESIGATGASRASALPAPSRPSFRRVSIRERLGGALARSVSSGKMFAAATAVTRQRKATKGPIREEEADEQDEAAAARRSQPQQPHAELGEEEEVLVFQRLYESSPRYLPIHYLKEFVTELPPPLGPKGYFGGKGLTAARVLEYIRSLEVPVNQYGYVYYQDVLQAVLRRAFELQTQIPQAMRIPFKNKPVFLAHEWYAAVAVQSVWRGQTLRSKLESRAVHQRSSSLHRHHHHQQQHSQLRKSSVSVGGLGTSLSGSRHLRISIDRGGSSGSASDAMGSGGLIVSGSGGSPVSPSHSPTVIAGSPTNGTAFSPSKRASPKTILVDTPHGGPAPLSPIVLPPPPVSPSHQRRRTSLSRASRASSVASVAGAEAETSTPRAMDSTSTEAGPSVVLDSSRRRPLSHSEVGSRPASPDLPQREAQQDKAGGGTSDQEVLAKMLALAKLGDELLLAAPMPLMGTKAKAAAAGDQDQEVDLELMEMLANQRDEHELGQVDEGGLAAPGAVPAHERGLGSVGQVGGDNMSEIRRRAESV